jgi:hypothetical protein
VYIQTLSFDSFTSQWRTHGKTSMSLFCSVVFNHSRYNHTMLISFRYMTLRDEHKALKLAYNSKVEEVKRTNVQLTKIENLLKMKDKMDTQGNAFFSAVGETSTAT